MEKKKFKLGLVPKLIIAIIIGILFGQFLPTGFCRFVVTLSGFFSTYLKFIIPLMILAYVTMGIADLSQGAGQLLLITVALAYGSTLLAGTASYLVSSNLFPHFMTSGALDQISATADASLSENAIVFNDVTFEYSKAGAPSLSHISFSVKKGQTVGIIGGTGSGKTTLVNLISRFYDASKGTVLLDGQNIENYTRSDLRSRIGVVPQKAALFKGSIRDNLKWGREDASDEDLWQALTTAQGKEVVEGKPGQLDFMLEQNGKNLSGGQKQRLTIARALVKKPEILILDDSASALDFATDAALRKSLNRLDWKVTTFLVSQRSSSIQQADLILVLDNGTLAGKGTHAELLRTCDTYREIYFSQFPEERARYSSVSAGNIMKEVTV